MPSLCPAIRSILALALFLGLVATACQSGPRMGGQRLREARLDARVNGDRVLVVFMPDDWPATLDEEEQADYAGWAGLLEGYVEASDGIREVKKLDFRRADEVFSGRGLPVNEYTLLFLRGDGMALFANRPIFDPAVYAFADAFLVGREEELDWPEVLHAGETERGFPAEFKLVRIREVVFPPQVEEESAGGLPESGPVEIRRPMPVVPGKPVPLP